MGSDEAWTDDGLYHLEFYYTVDNHTRRGSGPRHSNTSYLPNPGRGRDPGNGEGPLLPAPSCLPQRISKTVLLMDVLGEEQLYSTYKGRFDMRLNLSVLGTEHPGYEE